MISYRTIFDISLAEGGDRSSIVPFVLSHDADHDRLMQVARPSRPNRNQGVLTLPHQILVDTRHINPISIMEGEHTMPTKSMLNSRFQICRYSYGLGQHPKTFELQTRNESRKNDGDRCIFLDIFTVSIDRRIRVHTLFCQNSYGSSNQGDSASALRTSIVLF